MSSHGWVTMQETCRNVETIAKLKRAKQAMRAKAGRLSGPYESEGANKTYQQAIRLSLSNLKDVMRQRRATGGQQGEHFKWRSALEIAVILTT